MERLMGGETAQLLWTDPPYGVRYVGKTREALTIKNDEAASLRGLLDDSLPVVQSALEPGSPFYIAHPAGALCAVFLESVLILGWRLHQTLIWVKDAMVLGHADYHYRHEPILYGWVPGPGRSGRGQHDGSKWYGDNAQTSVFEIERPKRSEQHPTMKPVELVRAHLLNSSRPGDFVLDPFCGSGTTLIAAQFEDRVARAMDIDPCYVDVICRRFQEQTGIVPVLERTGESHSFLDYEPALADDLAAAVGSHGY